MFQKALTHIDNVSNPSVWMQVGKMYDLIKNNKAAEDAYKQVVQLGATPAPLPQRQRCLSDGVRVRPSPAGLAEVLTPALLA